MLPQGWGTEAAAAAAHNSAKNTYVATTSVVWSLRWMCTHVYILYIYIHISNMWVCYTCAGACMYARICSPHGNLITLCSFICSHPGTNGRTGVGNTTSQATKNTQRTEGASSIQRETCSQNPCGKLQLGVGSRGHSQSLSLSLSPSLSIHMYIYI